VFSNPFYREFFDNLPDKEFELQEQNSNLTDKSIPVIYGMQRTVPSRIFTSISTKNTNDLIVIYAISEGPCEGVYRLYVDDVYVETDQPMTMTGSHNNGIRRPKQTDNPYYGIAEFEFMSGSESSINLSNLVSQNLNSPVQDMSNLSVLVCKFRFEGENSPYEGIPKIALDFFGRRVAPAGNPTGTVSYSTDPAAHIQDYLLNSTYGAGFSNSAIETTSFGNATTFFASDTDLILSNGQTYTTKRYTSNVTINTAQTIEQNIKNMLKINSCLMPYINGQFVLVTEQTGSPEVDITENSFVEQVRITYPDRATKYNSVRYTFLDADNGFQATTRTWPRTQELINPYITEDGGSVNVLDLSLDSITDPYMAERVARQFWIRSRASAKYEFRVFKDLFQYQVGDIVRLKLSVPDIDYQPVRIVSMSLQPDFTVQVEAYTHSDTFFWPYANYTQLPEDYKGALIPTTGGKLIRPKEEGSGGAIVPKEPGDANPGPGDPGGNNSIFPPAPASFEFNAATVNGFSNYSLLGPNSEYIIGAVRSAGATSLGLGFTYENDTSYHTGTQRAFLAFGAKRISGLEFTRGYYAFAPTLTERTGASKRIGFCYTDFQGRYGFTLGNLNVLFDPERLSFDQTVRYEDKNVGGRGTYTGGFDIAAQYVPVLLQGAGDPDGVHKMEQELTAGIKWFVQGDVYSSGVASIKRSSFFTDLEGTYPFYAYNFNHAIRSSDYENLYGRVTFNSTNSYTPQSPGKDAEIDFSVKFFEMETQAPYRFVKYIGKVDYKIKNTLMSPATLNISRIFHASSLVTTLTATPPF